MVKNSIKIRGLVQKAQKLNDRCLTKKKKKEGRKVINIIHTFKMKLKDKSFQMKRAHWVLTKMEKEDEN